VMATKMERFTNRHVPPWLLRFRRVRLTGLVNPAPHKIPSLGSVTSRCLTEEESHELGELMPDAARRREFFRNGSICAVAVSEGKVCAMAWGRPGPGDCVTDDNVRLGFRWGLEAGEAWLHNGEALTGARGSGVYLTAFRRLMEEMVNRGIARCYGLITDGNVESTRTHTRLGMREIATVRYVRMGGFGCYRWESPVVSGSGWTFERSYRICPGNFLQKPAA
jgi:hypothetical protein